MKHVLGVIAAVSMVASVMILRITPSTSYDRIVLTVCIGLQVALLASLYSPFDYEVKTTLAQLSHFGFVTSMVYGALAGSRPTLLLTVMLLAITLVSRLITKGCIYSVAEDPTSDNVKERPSWKSDWQLVGVLALALLRVFVKWFPSSMTQGALALVSTVGAAISWS